MQGTGFRDATVAAARAGGVLGWVRNAGDGTVLVHAEGEADAVEELLAFLGEGPAAAEVEGVEAEDVGLEGHEQFAIRGVAAGSFVVEARPRGFALRLEVDGAMRSWALPKEPSMDPATKRMAFPAPEAGEGGDGPPWDRGTYEQGGRVPWPEAIDRGHAVFVLHGEKLEGGFALQRIRAGDKPQWLLVKRKEDPPA